jgi:hypothetical protein
MTVILLGITLLILFVMLLYLLHNSFFSIKSDTIVAFVPDRGPVFTMACPIFRSYIVVIRTALKRNPSRPVIVQTTSIEHGPYAFTF